MIDKYTVTEIRNRNLSTSPEDMLIIRKIEMIEQMPKRLISPPKVKDVKADDLEPISLGSNFIALAHLLENNYNFDDYFVMHCQERKACTKEVFITLQALVRCAIGYSMSDITAATLFFKSAVASNVDLMSNKAFLNYIEKEVYNALTASLFQAIRSYMLNESEEMVRIKNSLLKFPNRSYDEISDWVRRSPRCTGTKLKDIKAYLMELYEDAKLHEFELVKSKEYNKCSVGIMWSLYNSTEGVNA